MRSLRKQVSQGRTCNRCGTANELDWDKELARDEQGNLEQTQFVEIGKRVILCNRCRLANEINVIKSG